MAVTTFVILTNRGATACTLQGRPRIQLVDTGGHPLPIEEKVSPEPDDRFVLQPGQRASAAFVWRNWCRPSPVGPLSVLLTLPGGGGQLTVRNGQGGSGSETPRCDAPTAASTLVVSPFGRLNP